MPLEARGDGRGTVCTKQSLLRQHRCRDSSVGLCRPRRPCHLRREKCAVTVTVLVAGLSSPSHFCRHRLQSPLRRAGRRRRRCRIVTVAIV